MKTVPLFLVCFVAAMSIALGMDFYANDMSSSSGWINSSSSGTFNFSTYDGRSAMRVYVPTSGSGYYGGAYNTTWVNGRVLHLNAVINTTSGTKASGDYFQIQYRKNKGALVAQFASDGLYIQNNAGSAINTGISVPTNTWTTWDIYSNQTADATALGKVYRDGEVVGSGIACAGGASAYTTSQLYVTQFGNQTSGVSTYIDTVSATSGGWEYTNTMGNISQWTKTTSPGHSANCTVVQETAGTETYLNYTVQNVSAPSIYVDTSAYRPVNTPSTRGVLEFKATFNALGPYNLGDRRYINFSVFRGTTTGFSVIMANNGIGFAADGSATSGSSALVDLGVPHIWRFEYDLKTLKCNVKKDGVTVLSNISFMNSSGSTGGRVEVQLRGGNAYTNAYVYWVHAYSLDSDETEG